MLYRIFFLFLFSLFSGLFYPQNIYEKCKVKKNSFDNIYRVDADDLKCIAENSTRQNTIFYTFGVWCQPCIYHLPNALGIELDYDAEVYILLVDGEESDYVRRAKKFFDDYSEKYNLSLKILLLKDIEGKKSKRRKKYREFLEEITPPNIENIDSMSKYIVLNNEGEVILVTSYKDKEQDPDWKDDRPMIRRLVLPLLQKKEK